MDPFEKAIRNAFEKGDPSDRAFREKVYRSAFAALERALQANSTITPEVADHRRQSLSNRISEIESEFIPAVPMVEPVASRAATQAPEPVARRDAPDVGAPSVAGERQRAYDDEIEPPSYGEYAPRARKRRPWVALLLTVVVLAILGVGAWVMLRPTPPAPVTRATPPMESEDFSPGQTETPAPSRVTIAGDDLSDWISVFDPSDASTVTAPGDSRAELTDEDGEALFVITSGASGSPILFDVGRGVLEQISGTRAVFNIVAQTEEGGETQISVECSLAELGDCGRKRYAVGPQREEFLFEITLPAIDPGAGGTIAINPDIEGGGKSVGIFAIRVSSTQ